MCFHIKSGQTNMNEARANFNIPQIEKTNVLNSQFSHGSKRNERFIHYLAIRFYSFHAERKKPTNILIFRMSTFFYECVVHRASVKRE